MERFGNTEGQHKEPGIDQRVNALVMREFGKGLSDMREPKEKADALYTLITRDEMEQDMPMAERLAELLIPLDTHPVTGRLMRRHKTALH